MNDWERAEIARSSVEATLTPEARLRMMPATFSRYAQPPIDTAFPLEYAYHLLGDVRGRRVLDLGCGSGANTILLAARGAQVCGLDISEELLRLARRRLAINGRGDQAVFVTGSAHALPFADGSIDIVFGIAVLHHLDLARACSEVRRVLTSGGRAIFQEPVSNSSAIRRVRSLIPYHAPDISPYEHPLTDVELSRFTDAFSRQSTRAFALPHVRVGEVLPIVRQRLHKMYEWDHALLHAVPSLSRYASIRVIDLTK